MKTVISAAALAVALLGPNVASANHPYPQPAGVDSYLSPEETEHREFLNVQRETFARGIDRRAAQSSALIGRKQQTQRTFFSHDGTRRY